MDNMWQFRGFLVWLLIICTETLHGILRELIFSPIFGDFRARQFAVFTGMILIFAVTYFCISWIRVPDRNSLFLLGFSWVMLTVLFEAGLGIWVLGLPVGRILEDYDITKGGLMGAGLLFMFFCPFLTAHLKRDELRGNELTG
ncbi:MAG: hypothetical protein R2681_03630 [Pyrinomonadaceae bacterium]